MVKISHSKIKTKSGEVVIADCWGNNAAMLCPVCKKNPILLIARPNQRGSEKSKASVCDCGAKIWMDPPADSYGDETEIVTVNFQ